MTKTKLRHATFLNMDCEIHYWHRKGETDKHILFFHGAGLDHHMFDVQLEAFDDSYSLALWDARGHGLSKLPKNITVLWTFPKVEYIDFL